jgi:spore germination cell wall hydrolase CwlJ-like protein
MKKFILALVMLASSVVSAQAVVTQELYSQEDRPEEYCLALNIYYEARGSNRADRLAVADVVLNRVQDSRYPDTVCDVVKQGRQDANGNMIRHQCQFSWYCDGKADRPADQDRWIDAQQLAYMVYVLNEYRGLTEGATHYHATYVEPRWARDLQLVGRIGEHIFYRWE